MSGQPIPEFGDRVAGTRYQPRPGSYGVIKGRDGTILLMQTETGLHLPGGGADMDEMPEQTLAREVREECGYCVMEPQKIGEAIQFVFAEGEDTSLNIAFSSKQPLARRRTTLWNWITP